MSSKDKKLVIVESPAKAKTIARFLGPGYQVDASYGHVRDLPTSAAEVPAKYKKEPWARLGVDVDNGFHPLYIVPADKKKHVTRLKGEVKEAAAVLLATDEDREGESISWHLLQVLKPPKRCRVERIVFHEITRTAIEEALRHPRDVDEALVRAQESRRILDRLFGYTLSPLLWRKVAPRLSAGRVQSVATRLIVERERLRRAFVPSEYWRITAALDTGHGTFKTTLARVDGARVATAKSFDATTGALKEKKHLVLDQARAKEVADRLARARPWVVSRLEQKEGTERPSPPYITSTLQQDANRRLRFSAKRTMQIAQSLYEGVDLDGERVGLITYMRTDSVTLAEQALSEARRLIEQRFGVEFLPPAPVRYRTRTKNAQEAHEAIRPTDLWRTPESVKPYLDADQFRLYDMIWRRTLASQMVPARILWTNVEVTVDDCVFHARGKQVTFPGYQKVMSPGRTEADNGGEKATLLPSLSHGQEVVPLEVLPQGQSTRPPARYTEAGLVKRLEEEGIGRPSTYATIISTIQSRNYVVKRGQELVPTFTAFGVTEFLERHFPDLVDVGFTSKMENELDDIARGKRDMLDYLRAFYFGKDGKGGLVARVKEEEARLEYPRIAIGTSRTGEPIVVRMGRFGPYLQRGEGGEGNVAAIPADIAPADLTVEVAEQLLDARADDPKVLTTDPASGRPVRLQRGRFGEYLEVDQDEEAKARGEKPHRVSIPRDLRDTEITPEIARKLIALPRTLGTHPEDGEAIVANIGRFGPYVQHGNDYRRLGSWRDACEITLEAALELFKQPKRRGRGATAKVLRDFGELPDGTGSIRVLDGRYGPYVTDGKVNVTLPKGTTPEALSLDEARTLLAEKSKQAAARKSKRRTGSSAAKTSKTSKKTKASATTKTKKPSRKASKAKEGAATPSPAGSRAGARASRASKPAGQGGVVESGTAPAEPPSLDSAGHGVVEASAQR